MGQQLSLVAFYGEKSDHAVWNFIEGLQDKITSILGAGIFIPYDPGKIHGTIIGLEGRRIGDEIINENYFKKYNDLRAMDIQGLIDSIANDDDLFPIYIKVGGYQEEERFPFTSNGKHPYFRSFSIQKKAIVAIGWPIEKVGGNLLYTASLDMLRRRCNAFNVLHKYHNPPQPYDNDFFLVLGNVEEELEDGLVEACEMQIRNDLANSSFSPIAITKNDLKIVAYAERDTTFSQVDVANIFSLEAAARQIDQLIKRYPDLVRS